MRREAVLNYDLDKARIVPVTRHAIIVATLLVFYSFLWGVVEPSAVGLRVCGILSCA